MNIPNEQGDGIRLLSLDGGGSGSLSQLRILAEYMSRLAHDKGVDVDSLFPADLFDIIGAVGYGAYIALLIGPLRMPVSQATEELVTLGTTLFPPGQTEMPTAKENSKRLKEAVEEMLKRQQLPIDIKLNDARLPGSHSKVAIFVTQCASPTHCTPFRTYASREPTFNCTLVEAASAALSTPPFFDPVSIGPRRRQQEYSSACIGFSNPTHELLKEAEKQFGQDRRVSTILSIGCGRTPAISADSSSSTLEGHHALLRRIATDGEKVSRELSSQLFNVDAYLRLNVERGLEDSHMTNWDELGAIDGHTEVYLRETTVSKAVESSLQALQNRLGLIDLGRLTRSTQVQTQAKKTPAVSPYFVVRREYWESMKRHLVISPEDKRKIMVLSGMGGCGKTQMVAYFVEKYHSRYKHVFFVDATSHSSIQADLQSAIRALGAGNEQKTFEEAIKFLEDGAHDGNWIMVFDNADDPAVNLIRYLPTCFHGTILITTRNPGLGQLNTTAHLQLGPMGDSEAYEALVRAAHRTLPLSPDEDVSAKKLMVELGSLAVALIQAGSYCYGISATQNNGHAQYTFQQYLDLFKRYRKELMTKENRTSLDQYTRGAYTTFNLSYSLLSQSAREFLHLSGFFHHADIPLPMFEYAAQDGFSDWFEFLARPESHGAVKERLKTLLCPGGMWNELSIHEIIHCLQSFSLVSTTSISGMIFLRFHPLVHVWSRDVLRAREGEEYRKMAMQVIVSCTAPSNATFYRFLRPHMTALLQGQQMLEMHANDQMGFGRVLMEMGEYSQAEVVFQAALNTMDKKLGKHNLNTMGASSWLANLYRQQGQWTKAEKMQLEMLEQRQRLLSKVHPDTITAAACLANTYHAQGRWKEAERMQVEVLEQRQRLQGEDHPDTIIAAACLANTYHAQGRWKEAEKMQVEVLEQRQRLLSKGHPDTITSAGNLADTYRTQGKWKEAEKMEVEVLEQCQRLMSKDHPDKISAAGNLADTYRAQGKWKEAEKMQVEVLEQRQRLLSKVHPDTIRAAASLAYTYHAQGRWKEAEKMRVEVLEQRQRLLSKDHPDTILAAENLANTYHAQGRWKEAEKMEVEVLEQRLQLLSKDHPHTIRAAANLATTYHYQGKWKEAEKMQVEVLKQCQRLLSKDHPDTITAAANLADTCGTQGKWKEAEKIQVEVLEQRRRLLSSDHPETIRSVHNLAWNYHCQGRHAEAEELQAEAVEAAQRVLGDEHPHTVVYIKNLAEFRRANAASTWKVAESSSSTTRFLRPRSFRYK